MKNIQKNMGYRYIKMTPDYPNRIKFRDKILPFYHEEYAAVVLDRLFMIKLKIRLLS